MYYLTKRDSDVVILSLAYCGSQLADSPHFLIYEQNTEFGFNGLELGNIVP